MNSMLLSIETGEMMGEVIMRLKRIRNNMFPPFLLVISSYFSSVFATFQVIFLKVS